MRTEFVYSIIALGAVPVVTNAADVISMEEKVSENGGAIKFELGELVPGKYTFSAKLTSTVYGVKVNIAGKDIEGEFSGNSTDVSFDFTLGEETNVDVVLVSTDPGESGAEFSVADAKVILDFDFADIKSTLATKAEELANTIGELNYAAKESDVNAANALKTKAEEIADSYTDYKNYKLYLGAGETTIDGEIDALADKAAAAEAAYQNEQAYKRVNTAITNIKAKYNAAVADLKVTLVNEAAYLLASALADLDENINKKITAATQASYASYTGKTAEADEANNMALVPTEDKLNEIVDDWKEQGTTNQNAYDALHAKVTTLQAQLAAITPVEAIASLFPKTEAETAIDAVNTKVEAAKNTAAQLTLDVSAEETAAQTKINELESKVNTANAEYNANEATKAAIATLQTNLNNAKTTVNALKSADGNYEAKNYYGDYVDAIQGEITDLSAAAAAAYKADGTGTAVAYNAALNTEAIQNEIDTYAGTTEPAVDGMPKQAVDKYNTLQTAINSYTQQLADARAQVENLAVYTDEAYNYKTKFDLINKRINDIKKAITAAQEKKGAEHWNAMLAISEDAAITTDIDNLLAQVQGDQNQYDADHLTTGMTVLEGKITAFKAKEASALGADATVFQSVGTGIETAYNAMKTAKNAINAQSETVDYTAKVSTDAAAWGGDVCPGDNSFAETYGKADAVAETGVIMQQIVNGVENGTYTVELYANANFTSGRGFDSAMSDGATDVAYVFANGVQTPIVAHKDGGLDGSYTINNVTVSDGTLTIGLAKAKAGTNWHTIKIKSLTANTASLIQGWGKKIDDLNAQQDALESVANDVAAKVAANGTAKTTLAASIDGLQTKIGTFKDTYKVGDDANTTLGNRGKADGAVTTEVGEIETALNTLENANNAVTTTAVSDENETSKVGTKKADWKSPLSYGDGENYAENNGTVESYKKTCEGTGVVLNQTVTGLDNGIYNVVLTANANFTNDRGFDSDLVDGATDAAYVFANGVKQPVVSHVNTDWTLQDITIENVIVSDGTLELGLGKNTAQTNWHAIQIKSLTYHENDQTATYNTAETGYNAQYTALAGRVTKLENDAPGIKTAVENNTEAYTEAQTALTDLGTYELDNLKNLADVSGADGNYSTSVAKKSDPSNWAVFRSDLDADKTYPAKKAAIDATITALTDAITAANAAETLPYPWAGEITVTTEDDPATDANEASSTTYKISEIKATIDALKAEAADESANYWAYRNTNKANITAVTDAITAERTDLETSTGAGALDYYNGVLDGYEAEKQAIYDDMLASLKARTAVSKKDGWIADLKTLRENKVKQVKKNAAANLAKYNEQKAAAEDAQTLWNDTYTEIAATDKSSKRDDWLDALDAIQVTLTAAKDSVEANYPGGESVAKAQDFAAIEAEINGVKARQSEAYIDQITEDNKVAHESFMGNETMKGAIQSATEAYQRAVKERAAYSSTNTDIKAAVDAAAATLDEALYNCPNKLADLTTEENEAYAATGSPDVFDVSEYNTRALAIEQDITEQLDNFKLNVQNALTEYWTPLKNEYNAKVTAAANAISSYSKLTAKQKSNAFKDVKDLIAKGDAGVESTTLSEVEDAMAALENIDSLLAADKDAAAKKDIDALVNIADSKYQEVKEYIEGIDDAISAKATQLQALETAYEQVSGIDAERNFATHDASVAALGADNDETTGNGFIQKANACKQTVETAVAADNANTAAYDEIVAELTDVEKKLAEAKAAAAPYKYQTDFSTLDELLEQGKTAADNYKTAGTAATYKDAMLTAIDQNAAQIDETLKTAFNSEKTGLATDISELKNQFNTYVANNGLNETATGYKQEIDELNDALVAAEIKDVDEPADGIKYNDILAATEALVEIQTDIANKQTELLAANASTANADVLADFQSQISELEATASLEDYNEWVGQQPYGNTTLGEAITALNQQIADVKTAINAEQNISFYKDQYQKQIDDIKAKLDPVVAQITAKDAQFKANATAYAALSAEIDELQGKIDAAKEKVANYEYVGPGKTYDYTSRYIESYTGDPAVLTGGAQYLLNQSKEAIETANDNKTLDENSVVANKTRIETNIQNYLDFSANAELNAQRSNLNTLLTNAIDDKYKAQTYSSALWARLQEEKTGIANEINDLADSIAYSYSYYYYDENNQYVSKDRTSDADYAEQIAEVNRIKEEINNLGEAVANLKLLGDANTDGKVNVLDYQKVLNMILDPTLQPEEGTDLFTNIDINQSEVIEVGDLTAIVNYIIRNGDWQGYAAARSFSRGGNESLSLDYSSVESGVQRIAVNLENANSYTAFQMDVVLPDGMKIAGTSLSSRAGESHKLYSRTQLDGSVRVLVSSVSGEAFSGNEGAVLYIDVEGANANSVEILNILFSDVNANTREFRLGSNVTGIDAVGNTFEALKQKVYDLGGRVMNGVKKGINIIRNADGSTKKVAK